MDSGLNLEKNNNANIKLKNIFIITIIIISGSSNLIWKENYCFLNL